MAVNNQDKTILGEGLFLDASQFSLERLDYTFLTAGPIGWWNVSDVKHVSCLRFKLGYFLSFGEDGRVWAK